MSENKKHIIEILIALAYAAVFWFLLQGTDAFEALYEYTRQHEELELDEAILTIPIILIVVIWFAIRRMKDIRKILKEKEKLNEELRQANERIKKLSKDREQFIGIAYHELANSLNGVSGALQLIELSESEKETEQNLIQARILSEGLRQYSSDILTVVKHILSETVEDFIDFDIRQSITDAVATARFKSDQKELDFSLCFDPSLPKELHGNPKLIRHIVQNLAENSVKYTSKGSIEIHCSYNQSNNNSLLVSVKDTGQGIPEELQQTIFDAYTQVGHNNDESGGVGLGLFIVKRLVKVLNGQISIEKNLPHGSIFQISIPL